MTDQCYVYEVTDTVTGKWYVGSRAAKGCHPSELGVKYFTSSKVVSPIFKSDPARFEKKVIVVSDRDYVVKVESDILKFRNAKNDPRSYNAWNGDGKFNASKAAEITVLIGVGVHNRTKEQRVEDARAGGLLGGKVTRSRGVGIFARSLEVMKAAGRHAGLTQDVSIKVANGKKTGAWAKENKIGFCGMSLEQRKANGEKTASRRFKCSSCGLISTAGGISIHQKSTSHSGKENAN